MSKRGNNNLDVAELVVDVTKDMDISQKFRFEQALVELVPQAIRRAANIAKAPTKKSQKKPKEGT